MKMVRDSSSDDEDGNQALVPQRDLKPFSLQHNHPRVPAFEICNNLNVRIGREYCSRRWRWYLLSICIPLVLILVFFSLDFGRLFRGVTIIRPEFSEGRMREAELRALFLLRNQQLKLLQLWNRIVPRSIPSPPESTSSNNSSSDPAKADLHGNQSSLFSEEFRSALLEQIKLNKQIQAALLSTHLIKNASLLPDNETAGVYSSGYGVHGCRKADLPVYRRTIEWSPKKDRFLFSICLSGQMSNHLICLEKHMLFAALLGRVLVLPSHKVDYDYSQVLDINHINQCLGKEVVISYDDFAMKMKNRLKIDRLLCYIANPPCFLDEEHIKRIKSLGISFGNVEAAWPEDVNLNVQKKRIVADIIPKFSSDEEVIAIGDMFYADVEDDWIMQPGGPINHNCKALIQPSRLILLTAQRFVQTFLGGNFIALHFRRHGFLKFCNAKKDSCFYPIPQAADCILRIVGLANTPVIYLSTDAHESETDLLQSLVVLEGKTVPLVKRPSHNSADKWDALLYRNHIGGNAQVEAMLDKTISAMSSVFIGTSGSTFTDDILRLRRGWGTASLCDEYLCKGELPNFIAEIE